MPSWGAIVPHQVDGVQEGSMLMHQEPAGSAGVSGFQVFAGAQSYFQEFREV